MPRTLGVVLMVCGVLAVMYGGIGYAWPETVGHIGRLRLTTEHHSMLLIPPFAGFIAFGVGLYLLVAAPRAKA